MKKRKTKKEKKRLILITFIIIGLISFIVISSYRNFSKIVENKNSIKDLKVEYNDLLEKKESLSSEVIKMKDPQYLARYAKEKYMYSSENEVIIRID